MSSTFRRIGLSPELATCSCRARSTPSSRRPAAARNREMDAKHFRRRTLLDFDTTGPNAEEDARDRSPRPITRGQARKGFPAVQFEPAHIDGYDFTLCGPVRAYRTTVVTRSSRRSRERQGTQGVERGLAHVGPKQMAKPQGQACPIIPARLPITRGRTSGIGELSVAIAARAADTARAAASMVRQSQLAVGSASRRCILGRR